MTALAGMAQLVGALSHDRKILGLIPGQGTYLGVGPVPYSVYSRQPINVSLSHQCLSLPLSPSLRAMSSGKDKKKLKKTKVFHFKYTNRFLLFWLNS